MNRHEFDVHYSEAQIRRSSWAYVRISVRRAMNRSGWLALLIVLAVWCWLVASGASGFFIWSLPVVLASFAIFIVAVWRSHIRDSIARLSRMKTRAARVVAEDEQLTISSDLGTATMPWTTFTESIDGPDAIYLKAGRSQLINLPTEGVDERALQFIRERITAHQPKG